jgi:hypothetical protein
MTSLRDNKDMVSNKLYSEEVKVQY